MAILAIEHSPIMILNKLYFILNEIDNVNKVLGGGKILDILWCGLKYGASPRNYLLFDFSNSTSHERKTFLTHRWNQKIQEKFNAHEDIWQLQNKFEFATRMRDKFGRKFAKSDSISFDNFMNLFNGGKVVCKPLCGGQGQGIKVYDINKENAIDVYKEIQALPISLLEQWLPQHEKMNEIYDGAVNPIRLQTLYVNNEIKFIAATLTLGNGTTIANASAQKAIFALVSVTSGMVVTDGYDYNGNSYKEHPISKIPIKGFMIPFWKELLDFVECTAKQFPTIRHIGWDIAITPNGPCIIEGNNDPGYTAYQLPQLTGKHIGNLSSYLPFI